MDNIKINVEIQLLSGATLLVKVRHQEMHTLHWIEKNIGASGLFKLGSVLLNMKNVCAIEIKEE